MSEFREFASGTWLQKENYGWPHSRRFRAKFSDGVLRSGECGLPDTFFSIPARAKIDGVWVYGFLTIEDDVVLFTQNKENRDDGR